MPSPRDDTDAEPDRDPLDPFPTLLASLRTRTRDPIPTYAAIARSPVDHARALPAAEGSSSNSGQNAGPSTNVNGTATGNGGWSSDDVDRVDSLDEITTFPSSSSHFRSSPPPAPPPPRAQTQAEADRLRNLFSIPHNGTSSDPLPPSDNVRRTPAPAGGAVPGSVLSPASTHRPTGTGAEGTRVRMPMIDYLMMSPGSRDTAADAVARALVRGETVPELFEGTWDEGMDAATRHLNGGNNGEVQEPPYPTRTRTRIVPASLGRRDGQAGDQPPNPITASATNPPTEVAMATIRARLARLRADVGLPPNRGGDGEGRRSVAARPAGTRQATIPRIIHQRPEDSDANEDREAPRGADERRRQWRFMSTVDRQIRVRQEEAELRRMRDEGIELVPGPIIRRETDTMEDTMTRARGGMTERAARRQARRQDRETIHEPGLALGPQPGTRMEETERFLTAVNRTRRIADETAALRRIRDHAEMLAYPPGGPGPEDEDEEDFGIWTTVGPDTAATTRRVRPFYAHPNITGDIDIDAWETAFGEDPPPLRRGGNNRRRGNNIRGPLEGHLPRAHGATETRDVRPLEVPNIAGLEPTNIGVNGDIVLVTSRRRERVEENIQKRADSIKDGKRRKVAEDEIKSYSKPKTTQWPTYLNHTSLDQVSMLPRLPREFESTSETFLRVSYSSIGRPLIKFIDHPQLTGTDADASNIATLQPIPVECGIYYYEVECICEGEEGFMSVGYKVGKRSQNRLVGWDKGTFGWHSDDGMCFEQSGSGSDFAAKWTSGDTVGVGVDFTTGRAFFTKNGALIGHRFKNLNSGLRPAFGLRSKGEELCINFNGPFRFDIDSYVETIKDKFAQEINKVTVDRIPKLELWRNGMEQTVDEIMMAINNNEPMHRDGMETDQVDKPKEDVATDPKSELPVTSVLREPVEQTTAAFVLNFLTQHGYSSTLQSTRQEMIKRDWISADLKPPSDSQLEPVHQISRQMLDLSAPMPIDLIDTWCHESELMNRSAVLQLVHLIRQSQARPEDDMEEALAYGKELREQSRKKGPSDTISLEWDSTSLEWLDEASGCLGLPMTKEQVDSWDKRRAELANKVEASIRFTHCLEPESKLATSIKQVQVINTLLAPRDPSTTFIDVRQQLGLK